MKYKKLMVVILSVVILFGALPFTTFTASAATTEYTEGYFTYTVKNDKATITDCDISIIGNLTIPSTLGDYPVTSIGNSAFQDCSSLISINIPDCVTNIGNFAFQYCSSLISINIPDSVTDIGVGALWGCGLLINIKIPLGVTSIEDCSFYDCYSLTSINMSSSIISIDSYAFFGCRSLTDITIPEGVISIGASAFSGCHSLTSINIPESVTNIDLFAFEYCSSLKETYITNIEEWNRIALKNKSSNPMYYAKNLYVNNNRLTDLEIPDGTEAVNQYTFYNCNSIKNIFIPESLILIKQDAFYNCSGIENVYFEGTAEDWAKITILSGNDYLQNATVYYNSSDIPGGITSIEISKSPDKVQYIENEEELDLTGGILTVNYDGGATQDIDLNTLNVTGFDNSVLGKQTVTVKYGEFSTEFEIEIIPRPISFVAISSFPNNREYILGDTLNLIGGKIAVGYPEGNYEIFDLTTDMVSNYDMNKSGYQILTVTYKGYSTEFAITIFKNGDINGDDNIDAIDITLLKLNLLNNDKNTTRYDINQDGVLDIRDLVRLKKKLAGMRRTLKDSFLKVRALRARESREV